MTSDTHKINQACEDYLHYHSTILQPAAEELDNHLSNNDLKLHHVFQTNMLTAHMIDYLHAIRKVKTVKKESRKDLVKGFDKFYAVEGALWLNNKFQLVDIVNIALKHIKPDKKINKESIHEYGEISFRCLHEEHGLVLFEADKYRFDYARVVLRPILQVVVPRLFEEVDDVVSFALCDFDDEGVAGDFNFDFDDPIEKMIDYCNPTCLDCGEGKEECHCSEFIYKGKSGEFRGDFDKSFDFDSVMSQISGAYSRH